VVAASNWDVAPDAPDAPQTWSLHNGAPLPLQPVPPAPPAPAPAPDPMAPLNAVNIPQPMFDAANEAMSGGMPAGLPAVPGDLPAMAQGIPHLASPENLPPGAALAPTGPQQSPNVTYLKEIWHAIQTQDISGQDALLALTQRPLTTPDTPGGPPPNTPIGAPVNPAAAPAPLGAPVPAPLPAPAPAPAPVPPPA
jgi:hypothetical protein